MATAGPYASVPFRTYKLYAISSYSDHRPSAIRSLSCYQLYALRRAAPTLARR